MGEIYVTFLTFYGLVMGFQVFFFAGAHMCMFVHTFKSVCDNIHMHTLSQFILGGEYVQ